MVVVKGITPLANQWISVIDNNAKYNVFIMLKDGSKKKIVQIAQVVVTANTLVVFFILVYIRHTKHAIYIYICIYIYNIYIKFDMH